MTFTRRHFLGAAAATVAAAPAAAQTAEQRVVQIPYEWLPTDIDLAQPTQAGIIHVDLANTWLYWITGPQTARRYKIAVGAAGRNFQGQATVRRKAEWPSWTPTASMIAAEPHIYAQSAGGLPGGHPRNPLGARALHLYQGNRDTLYRIHGTPQPWTIGQAVSSGCIRLTNDDVIELYPNVTLGTKVISYS